MNRRKYVLIIIVLLTIFTSYLTLLNSVPFIGIRLAEDDEGSYFVNSLIDVGWGYHNGVKIGDQVVLINKKNPKLTPSVINYKAIENVDSITLYRDGRFERSYIINTVNSSQQFIFYFLIPTLYFIVCLVLSLFLYTKHTTNSSTILIYLLLSVSISYISACLKLKLFPFVQYIQYLTFLVSPILYLHFIYEYMKENNSVWFSKKVLYFLYLVALIGFGSYFSFENDEIILRVFLLILCCLLFILINGLFFIKNSGIKETYRWFFYSIALALGPFLLFTLIPDIFFNKILVRGELTSIFFFTVPLFFLFSVVSGKVYALTLFIKQLPYYSAISFFITSVIATVYFGLASSTMNFELIINVLLLLFILIITSFYFKNSLDRTLRKSLFVSKHFYQQSLYRYSEQLKKEKDLEGIIEALLRELKEVLGSKELDVILISKRSGIICIESKALLNMYKSLITKVRQDYQHIGKVTQFNNSFSVVFGEREDYRFVLLGKCKKNLTGLGEEQVDWLATLAYYSSIALENLVKVEDLLLELRKAKSDSNSNWVNRLIFSWSEDERKKLAGDIHDTFLQDIIMLKRKIETLNHEKEDCQFTNDLVDLEEYIEDIIFNIRETCYELTPPLLSELGLQASIEDLTMKFHLRSNVHLNVKLDEPFDEHCLTIDYKRLIYRTIQELLNNAIKHSQATKVEISLKIKGRHILLNYEDNGVGIDSVSTNDREKGMGLLSIKERIRSFGGSIDFISSPGEGLVVISDIPIV